MPDPPSFIFTLLERVEKNQAGEAILQIRKLYYPGGTEGEVYIEARIEKILKRNNAQVVENKTQWIERLKEINDYTYKKVRLKNQELMQKLETRNDIFTVRLFQYFQTVEGRFEKWYDEYHVKPPIECRQAPGVTDWRGNKTEFARYIRKEYETHQDEYRSLRDATFKIYDKYHFPFEWTKEKCDGLVRKN